ncbi:MAG: DnaD domain protein [Clostridiales Family XIII bacterium]|jgi:DnaD/phage-associated family protein|nr:DnaD domain protein [Clostridiales Family XIII bacterium]
MKFTKEHSKNYYLGDTTISNVFIAEYLPGASGDHVRVYLYAYMHSGIGRILSNESIAKTLKLNVEDVMAAWTYFEKCGVVRKSYPSPSDKLHYDIIFVDLKGSLFGGEPTPAIPSSERFPLDRDDIRTLFRDIETITGKPISSPDIQRIGQLLDEYDVEPDLITFAYDYCMRNSKRCSAAYVSGIIREWSLQGVRTAEDAAAYLEQNDIRFAQYRKIMKALGLSQATVTDEEKRIFDQWMDEYELRVEEILNTAKKAAGKQNKFDYVKKIIDSEQAKKRGGSDASADGRQSGAGGRKKFYEERRRKGESAAEKRRAEVYETIPEVRVLEEDIKRLNIELLSALHSGADNKKSAMEKTDKSLAASLEKKKMLLETAGFPANHMDVVYCCPICRDTGQTDNGTSCACYEFPRD